MFVPRASGFVCLPFDATFGADLTHRTVDEGLHLVRIGVRIPCFDVLDSAMKNMSADGLFDEFREIAFFHSLGAQKGAQGEIRFLRYLDVPADSFFLHIFTSRYTDKHLYTYCIL